MGVLGRGPGSIRFGGKSMKRSSVFARHAASVLAAAAAIAATFVTAAPAAEPPAQSCSYDLGMRTLVCVDAGEDLNRAVLEQTHLLVVTPPSWPVAATADPSAARVLPEGVRATFVQSQLFDDAGYGGSFFQITNSSACNGSTTWYFGPLGNVGWSGRVSSFKSFSGCSTKLWQGTAYTGASYGYAVNASSLGSMNDQANSVTLR